MYCFVILLLFNEMQMSVRRFSAIPHLRAKLAECVLGDFIDSLNINLSLKNEQVEMKTQIKKRVNKTLLTFYLLLLDVY